MKSYKAITCYLYTGYLTRVDLCTPLLLASVLKDLLAIQAQRVVTEGIFDSSPTFLFESLDSSSI
jgi:hypothetical protein